MIRTIVLTLSMALIAFVPAWGKLTHFITVDESGEPVPGVKVKMSWMIVDGPDKGEVPRELFVSNAEGRFCPGENFSPFAYVDGIEKEGYYAEEYLNLHDEGYYPPDLYTAERPFRVVLRKLIPEKAFVIGRLGRKYGFSVVKKGETGTPFPLWVVGNYAGKEHAEADCFALPRFDEIKNAWMCSFWTTNAHGGVLATTNRVYMAPSVGYKERIEVPLEMCFQPTFTLYVKTFEPQLYGMICLYGYGSDRRERFWKSKGSPHYHGVEDRPDVDKPFGVLQMEWFGVNPFGDRVLEAYPHAILGFDKLHDAIWSELKQHRYPPRPDMPARMENYRRYWKNMKEWQEKKHRAWELEQQREEIKKNNPSDVRRLEEIDKKISALTPEIRALHEEKYRLEAESQTLNLPPGMTEKDKYPDKK